MIHLALIVVHNLQDNEAQIEAIKPHLTLQEENHDEFNDKGEIIGSFKTYFYTFKDLSVEHILRVYQIIPFGITPPANYDDIDSHKVYYGVGDEDKTGDHPRFFNWGVKRGTDYGADIVIEIKDYTKFDVSKLEQRIAKLADKNDKTEFVDGQSSRYATLTMLKEVGQLKEDQAIESSITDLKERVIEKGLEHG